MKNAYVEITNICNLDCEFCPGHKRAYRHMDPEEFDIIAKRLSGKVENLFLHIMGEPLLHPKLKRIFETVDEMNFNVKLTTNGSVIMDKLDILCSSKNLKTVCISLHSFEGNSMGNMVMLKLKKYLEGCITAAEKLAKSGKFVVLRLWNLDGDSKKKSQNSLNGAILKELEKAFPPSREEWVKNHRGVRIATHIFIEWGERFDWPDITEAPIEVEPFASEYGSDKCQALLTQIGILCDGTVVPCCLDRNGDIPLGNIFESSLDEILSGQRAKKMKEAMEHHRFIEPLCHTCGFRR
ncbi:MAG: SPASM domain-containing protein [Clostridia bacterium]|nr:SPASM domain-containing protein [Clostridia bacterium]